MKISVIDIGSNSVRLATFEGGKTLYKRLNTTRLGEGLDKSGKISPAAMERTALAVCEFARAAAEEGAEKIYAFATEAVRSAQNGEEFLSRVKALSGLDTDVLSGEREAACGLAGVLGGADGGIIDIGGASTEITLRKGGKTFYSVSVKCGAVRLFDAAGRDRLKLQETIDGKIAPLRDIAVGNLPVYAIGGTATRLAAVRLGIKEYCPQKTDGLYITLREVENLASFLLENSVEYIKSVTICQKSSEIMGGGALLLAAIMRKLGLDGVTVSERDNLEGYMLSRGEE